MEYQKLLQLPHSVAFLTATLSTSYFGLIFGLFPT